jgi:hypothetical protein
MSKPIMVSYRTPSRALADELYTALESESLSPWMDYKGIEPGMRWREELLSTAFRNYDDVFSIMRPAAALRGQGEPAARPTLGV